MVHPASPILKPAAAADYLGLHQKTLANLRCHGAGPVFVRLGAGNIKGRVGYRLCDLEAYVAARTIDPAARAR